MSNTDDTKQVAVDDRERVPNASETGGPIILFFMIGFVLSLVVGWVVFPKLLYSQKKQPIDFNHVQHMELVDEGCESCHFFREDGSFSGAPTLAQCIDCHEEVQGDTPNEIKFVEAYVQKDREVPWLIYAKQPQCVYFSHVAHVKMGNMDCVTCHGYIGESTELPIYEQNRISLYSRNIWGKNIGGFKKNTWDRMKMDDCAECHGKEGVRQASVQTGKGGCFVCHK
ncbi:MAG: cytochrome c family protein [Deltaproteobacteria bacterium]|nr:cytochrome c family protein [Deltaproteobacteria bacterium]